MVKELLKRWSESGIRLPFAYDPESDKPSVTLMFFWITSFLSVVSLVLLHLKLIEYKATLMSLGFVLTAFIMYRLRKLDKVKIDLDNQSIELENNDKPEEKDNNNVK